MNSTCYLTGGHLFVVDCGLRFAEPTKLGVDAIIPAIDDCFKEAGGVTAYLITHAHEDHIGALPYILPRWPAPVYTTPWSAEVLRAKFKKHNLDEKKYSINIVRPGDFVRTPGFEVEWVHVNHSIPDAAALCIRTPSASVFHSSDFKFDANPVIEKPIDYSKLAEIGKAGIDLLLSDSTNSDKSGHSPSESSVYTPLLKVFEECKAAIVISTFASNFWRLKTIADICEKTGRKIYISGPGIEQSFAIAQALSLYNLPDHLRITESNINSIPRHELVVLATGCQGEFRSALSRIANGEHRFFRIQSGDTVILSSRIIPGNERPILYMLDNLKRRGAKIITSKDADGIHVSGHAYHEDLKKLIQLLTPRWYTPIHGAFTHLESNQLIGESTLADIDKSILIENGQIIELKDSKLALREKFLTDCQYIDSESGVVLSRNCLRQRLKIGELGAAIVTGVYDKQIKKWLVYPEIEFIGIAFPPQIDQVEWTKKLMTLTCQQLENNISDHLQAVDLIFENLRITIRRLLFGVLKKKPVVLVKIHIV